MPSGQALPPSIPRKESTEEEEEEKKVEEEQVFSPIDIEKYTEEEEKQHQDKMAKKNNGWLQLEKSWAVG